MSRKKVVKIVPQPPYHVNIGDRIHPDDPRPLKKDEVYRHMRAITEPYVVDDEWVVMIEDVNNNIFQVEVPLDGWHVVGGTKPPKERIIDNKPKLKKGDIVQLEKCPKYPLSETHTAKLTGDPFLSDYSWKVPIKFSCYGSQTAIYNCKDVALLGHSRVEILLDKARSKYMKLSKPAIVTAIVLAFIAILGLWLAGNYNDLVVSNNAVNNSRSKIDTELTRRYDLIDNIVASVQGSQAQESDVFGKIAEARKVGGNSSDPSVQAEANNTIDTQIALLPRLQENYPELRSNDQVTRLIQELQGTNNTIRDKRNNYNDTVTNYNNNITAFPKNIFANLFNFKQAKLFEATQQERNNPKVDLRRDQN